MTEWVSENYEYRTPVRKYREDCWEDLAKYLADHATDGLILFRETPTVIGEWQQDQMRYMFRGIVRFGKFPVDMPDRMKIPNVAVGTD